jgi:hypothetical protein
MRVQGRNTKVPRTVIQTLHILSTSGGTLRPPLLALSPSFQDTQGQTIEPFQQALH